MWLSRGHERVKDGVVYAGGKWIRYPVLSPQLELSMTWIFLGETLLSF